MANANYLLLWNAIILCRERWIQWFNKGGIDEDQPPGAASLKNDPGYNSTCWRVNIPLEKV
jgi:lipid II:glycine glycyltransferase (peptidoglycan interpeptide bridge formation enzyme)